MGFDLLTGLLDMPEYIGYIKKRNWSAIIILIQAARWRNRPVNVINNQIYESYQGVKILSS